MKKIICVALFLSAFINGFAQKIQFIGRLDNILKVRGALRVNNLKNNPTEDSTLTTDNLGNLKLVYNSINVLEPLYILDSIGERWLYLDTTGLGGIGGTAGWGLTGNSVSGSEFLGTTNNHSLLLKTNNSTAADFGVDKVLNLRYFTDNTTYDSLLTIGAQGSLNPVLKLSANTASARLTVSANNTLAGAVYPQQNGQSRYIAVTLVSGNTDSLLGGLYRDFVHSNYGNTKISAWGIPYNNRSLFEVYSENTSSIGLMVKAYGGFVPGDSKGGGVYINDTTQQSSSALTVSSTAQGALLPRMTTLQRSSISLPATGLLVFDLDSSSLFQYNGFSWQNLFNTYSGAVGEQNLLSVLSQGNQASLPIYLIEDTAQIKVTSTDQTTAVSIGTNGTTGYLKFKENLNGYESTIVSSTDPGGNVTYQLPTGSGTLAKQNESLSQFSSTTSAQLASVLSDETGTGATVFAGSPTFTGTVTIPTASVATTVSGAGTWTAGAINTGSNITGNIITASTLFRNASAGYYDWGSSKARMYSSAATAIEMKNNGNTDYASVQSLYHRFGSGSPEGVVTAPVGCIYSRTDGGAGTTLYVKESGTGNTGWVAK